MNLDLDKIGGLKTVITVALTLGGLIWQGAVFVTETKDTNKMVIRLTSVVDSLRLQQYGMQLRLEGRGLEYNPKKYLDSIKIAEAK